MNHVLKVRLGMFWNFRRGMFCCWCPLCVIMHTITLIFPANFMVKPWTNLSNLVTRKKSWSSSVWPWSQIIIANSCKIESLFFYLLGVQRNAKEHFMFFFLFQPSLWLEEITCLAIRNMGLLQRLITCIKTIWLILLRTCFQCFHEYMHDVHILVSCFISTVLETSVEQSCK